MGHLPSLPGRQAKLNRKGAELTDDFLVINGKRVSCGAEMAVPKYRQRKMRGDGLSEVAAGPPEEARPRVRIFHFQNLFPTRPGRIGPLRRDGNGSAHMHHLMKALQSSLFDKSICLVGAAYSPFSPQAMQCSSHEFSSAPSKQRRSWLEESNQRPPLALFALKGYRCNSLDESRC